MVNKYDVSVIICVKDGQDTITRQLSALAAQQSAPKFEVIVVDNCSTDRTVETVEDWKKHENPVFDLTVVAASLKPSIPYARNNGVKASAGRIIAFCDSDDAVGENWVSSYSQYVSSNELAGGRNIPVDGQGNVLYSVLGEGLVATNYLPHISGCSFAIERETYLRLGGFDESLPAYGFDDVEFSWHAQENGVDIKYIPEAVNLFTVSNSKTSIKKKFILGIGRVLMARRFPQYDSNKYGLISTVSDLFRTFKDILFCIIRGEKLDRRSLGRMVANLGRVVGSIKYSGRNYCPPRKGL